MARHTNSSRLQRNIKERNRRVYMKDLVGRLASLISPQTSKLSVPETLNQATSYIKHLQENEERLKRRKALLKADQESCSNNNNNNNNNRDNTRGNSSRLRTILNVRNLDSILEVNLICGSNNNFMFYEIIRILGEEGADVVDATQLNAGDEKLICTIKSKAISPRIGVETSRIQERLKELVL